MTGPPLSVTCPKCHHANQSGSLQCVNCNSSLPSENLSGTQVLDSGTQVLDEDWSTVVASQSAGATPALAPGRVLANRYEILQLLGEGGMGAVFKAMDRQLDRPVALKIIRPELAGSPTILRRFKEELLLARLVTHRNVIRIFDLGIADGIH